MTPQEIADFAQKAGVPVWAAYGLALLLGLGVPISAVAAWLSRRKETRDARVAADRQALSADTQALLDRLMRMVEDGDRRITELTNAQAGLLAELGKCQQAHGECAGEVTGLRSEVEMLRSMVDSLETQFQRMAGGHD